MDLLPPDAIYSIAINLDLPEILALCRSSKRFNNNICKSKNFWINKLYKDYGLSFNDYKNLDNRLGDNMSEPKELYKMLARYPEKVYSLAKHDHNINLMGVSALEMYKNNITSEYTIKYYLLKNGDYYLYFDDYPISPSFVVYDYLNSSDMVKQIINGVWKDINWGNSLDRTGETFEEFYGYKDYEDMREAINTKILTLLDRSERETNKRSIENEGFNTVVITVPKYSETDMKMYDTYVIHKFSVTGRSENYIPAPDNSFHLGVVYDLN